MAHDVFISYSHVDKAIADGICANLEGAGIRCWIAPRDITPGLDWPTAISTAIAASRIMVLVFSAHSNTSSDVSRELILAANSNLIIIPFKIDNTTPEPGKQYYLARTHWLDAMNPPTREQIGNLVACVKSFMNFKDEMAPAKPAQETLALHSEQVQVVTDSKNKLSKHKPKLLKSTRQQAADTERKSRKQISFSGRTWIWGSLILLAVIALGILSYEWIGKPESPVIPTYTSTYTHTVIATTTVTDTPIPTKRVTLTSSPQPEWVTVFAEPILSAIASRSPAYQDDFSKLNSAWTAVDYCDGSMQVLDGEILFPNCQGYLMGYEFSDFVLEVDAHILTDIGSGAWRVGFRVDSYSQLIIEVWHTGEVFMDVSGTLGSPGGGDTIDLVPTALPGLQVNHLLLIAKKDQYALFINGIPYYYIKDPAKQKGTVFLRSWGNTGGIYSTAFDNLKIWKIDDLP